MLSRVTPGLERAERPGDRHVDFGGAVGGDLEDGIVVVSTSVATFVRMIAAAPRSTAKLSPRVVAIAPSTRASAPIDR